MAILGPFSVGFPVDFRSGGDTTKAAFGKHIQEIERIYGIINAIDSDKISASEFSSQLTAHMDDSNPHPNLSLSSLGGNIDMSRVTGNLDASRVAGTLSNATISYLRVSGLDSHVQTLIPSNSGTGDGITELYRGSAGRANFNNTLILQWGILLLSPPHEEKEISISFPQAFSHDCFSVILTTAVNSASDIANVDWGVQLISDSVSRTGFKYYLQTYNINLTFQGELGLRYIAIGY